MNMTKNGLMGLLKNSVAETPEQQEAYDVLMHLCQNAGDNMLLDNLAAYSRYILWSGEDDVRYAIDNEMLESNELNDIPDGELDEFVAAAAARIDWDCVDETCCEAGNIIVCKAIEEELAERKRHKTQNFSVGNIRVHKPDGLHSWGIEYNFEPERADADANDFVAAVNVLKNARNMSGILFHQCGCLRDSFERGYKGYQFFEYWGPAPTVIVRRFAQAVAEKLECSVVSR